MQIRFLTVFFLSVLVVLFYGGNAHSACFESGKGNPTITRKADRARIRYAFVGQAIDMCKQHPDSPECRNTEIFTITVPPTDYCMSHPSDISCNAGAGVGPEGDMAFYMKLCNESAQKEHFREKYGLAGVRENCHRTCDIEEDVGVMIYQLTVSTCPNDCTNLCFNVCDYH